MLSCAKEPPHSAAALEVHRREQEHVEAVIVLRAQSRTTWHHAACRSGAKGSELDGVQGKMSDRECLLATRRRHRGEITVNAS